MGNLRKHLCILRWYSCSSGKNSDIIPLEMIKEGDFSMSVIEKVQSYLDQYNMGLKII